ncbi:MAG: ATP-binding protein [Xanthomonadales bacterium]|nr:ATP-binding protein [Xanthomonadales bacterium]
MVAILGARQVGKTTLARRFVTELESPVHFFDLEDPEDLARLAEPKLALQRLTGLIVLDEIQRKPEIFPVLRVLADRLDAPARFLVLGSASPDLLRQSSETLAGRIHFHRLGGFALDEVGAENWIRLWVRGGFPRSYLAESDSASLEWRLDFVRTFLERDLPQLGVRTASETMRRFWTMLAHGQASVWNAARLARAFGVSPPTVRDYLDRLTSALVVRQLQPWHANVRKRQVKSPKVSIADSGLVHALLGLQTHDDVLGHPVSGGSWESFVIQEIRGRLGARDEECFFWSTHAGAELDLLVVRGNQRRGFEIKHTAAPKTTRSMHRSMEDLELDSLDVIHAGSETFPLSPSIRAVSIARLWCDLEPF